MDAFRVISLRFWREIISYFCWCWTFLVPWRTNPFLLWCLLCFLACFFPQLTSLHCSPSHLVLRHPSYCYRVWSHIVDHSGFTSRTPLRSHVSGRVLTLQPTCRLSLASTFSFVCTCAQELLAVGLRFRFVVSGSIALDHFFSPFFLGTPTPTVQRH